MFDIALGIFLFLSPIVIMLGWHERLNGAILALQFYQFKSLSAENGILQFQFFEYGIILLFILALALKPLRDFKDKNLAWFMGLCVISVVIHPKTLTAFTPIFLGCLLYYLVVKYAKNIKRLLYVVVLVSALNTLFAVLQFFGIHWIYRVNNIIGLMCSPAHLGAYQALALPICYVINPFLSIIPLISLLLSQSLTAIIASLAGMVYLLYPKRAKIFINLAPTGLTVLLGVLIVLFVRNCQYITYKTTMRLGLWWTTLKQMFFNPLGYGLGTFAELSPKFYSYKGSWLSAYNEYLEIAFCVSIFGWFFIVEFLRDKFKGANSVRFISASCLIIVILCFGQSTLHYARLAGTIIPLFAFLEILKRREWCL